LEVNPNIFCLDVPDGNFLFGENVIRRAALDPGGFIRNQYAGQKCGKQVLKVAPVTVFAAYSGLVAGVEVLDVLDKVHFWLSIKVVSVAANVFCFCLSQNVKA